MIIWKPNYKSYPTLLPGNPIDIAGAVITPTQVMILGVTAASLAVLMWLVNYTKLGRAMRATAENPRVAALMGVKPDVVISCHLHHRCRLGGHRRCDVRIQLRYCPARHGLPARFEGLYGCGVRRYRQLGWCCGWCTFARLIEAIGAGYIGALTGGVLGSHYSDIFAFIVLIIVLTLRPSGLLGERVADRA